MATASRPSSKAPSAGRGWSLNVYLKPEDHKRLTALKLRWQCSWGEVIVRLMEKAGA